MKDRVRTLKEGKNGKGPVVYWMSRDQRVHYNWALLIAQEYALKIKASLIVVFCLAPDFLNATLRQYSFMLKGLEEVELGLQKKNISFCLLQGKPEIEIPRFVRSNNISVLFTDFDPLRIKRQWRSSVEENISVPFYEVDTHNIVPCWKTSVKQEYGAYTIRPKIKKLLPEYLTKISSLRKHPYAFGRKRIDTDWHTVRRNLKIDADVPEVSWIKPGEKAACNALRSFIKSRIDRYPELRNDPSKDGQSNLSPYLHFGQLSPHLVAMEVMESEAPKDSEDAFLEEFIIRRELSDNFCFYNSDYDNFNGFPNWAKESLNRHRKDRREYLYSHEQFEHAETHDELWNAAQMEMVKRGKMHGYMRMYWAKKILEWSESPDMAMQTAVFLNDRYELDGRDPNGYTGIAWSIGGVHDRAWSERRVFGKVRYMSYGGCRSKFDIKSYIEHVTKL